MHCYSVLWTRQMTQKHKKWNDGLLYYHTFNKKARVFSENNVLVQETFLSSHDAARLNIPEEEIGLNGELIVQIIEPIAHDCRLMDTSRGSKHFNIVPIKLEPQDG